MAGIFISYRRDDSQGFAGRLADDLSEIFGPDRVFRDIEIPAGSDFTDVLHRAIAASDLLLVVIGRRWADPSARGGGARLFEPADWVRTEIEAAFAQGKRIVPVLVGGARMPEVADLPQSLSRLPLLQAAVMTDRHWEVGVRELVERLKALCPVLSLAPTATDLRAGSPADVLREMGERFLDQVEERRRPRSYSSYARPGLGSRLIRSLVLGIRRFFGAAVFVALVYVGLRLFGNEQVLGLLDAFEARLQIGWERLQFYFAHL